MELTGFIKTKSTAKMTGLINMGAASVTLSLTRLISRRARGSFRFHVLATEIGFLVHFLQTR